MHLPAECRPTKIEPTKNTQNYSLLRKISNIVRREEGRDCVINVEGTAAEGFGSGKRWKVVPLRFVFLSRPKTKAMSVPCLCVSHIDVMSFFGVATALTAVSSSGGCFYHFFKLGVVHTLVVVPCL